MSKPSLFIAIICALLVFVACTPFTKFLDPTPTALPTPTPTPTPAPDPCSADAMRKLADEVKSLAQRYIASTETDDSWLPLIPDLMDLRRNMKNALNLPRCAERLNQALSHYTNLDASELQTIMNSIAGGSLEDAVKAARYWLVEKANLQSQNNQ
ncbi:MAG: hypothetical protein MK000_06850 [Anaerolineales bacterium]|nr:hypothetical protein [Anaerolineales bacterium]